MNESNEEPTRSGHSNSPSELGSNLAVPRGIEVLLKKAAVDPEFRLMLLEERGEAAKAIELELTPAESAMLKAIPAEQLEQLVTHTIVPCEQRRVFLGRTAAAMLVAVGASLLLLPMCAPAKSRGIQPDRQGCGGSRRKDRVDPAAPPSSTRDASPGQP